MGGTLSSAAESTIGSNDFLNDLCGAEPIRNHDEFWSKFAYQSLLSISQTIINSQQQQNQQPNNNNNNINSNNSSDTNLDTSTIDLNKSSSGIGIVARAVSSSSVLNIGDYFPLSLLHPDILDKHLFKYASLLRMFWFVLEFSYNNNVMTIIISSSLKDGNNLQTGSLSAFMLQLSQWLILRMEEGKVDESKTDEELSIVNREAILVTCNAFVIFRYLIHRIIMDCETNAEFLKTHLYHLPPGFKLSANLIENYCYIDEERDIEFEMEGKNRIRSPLVVRIFIETILLFLSENRVTIHNYLLHLEVMNCLLVLFSTTLYGGVTAGNEEEGEQEEDIVGKIQECSREHNIFLEEAISIMRIRKQFKSSCKSFDPKRLIHSLLQNHITYRLSKKEASPFQISIRTTLQKIFSKLGETASSILFLPYNAYRNIFYKETKEIEYSERLSEMLPELLGRRSIMNLLLLIFYGKNDRRVMNPYLSHFSTLTNLDDAINSQSFNSWSFNNHDDYSETVRSFDNKSIGSSSGSVGSSSGNGNGSGISFEKLFNSIVRDFEEEECTLLTYSLLHDNKSFREFVLSKSDSETILLPLLHKIYYSKNDKPNHIYTLLVVLTLLTQDTSFMINIHKQSIINSVPWFTERILDEIHLGSLIVAVLISVVHYNISHKKDMFLNRSCLAIISNSGPYFSNMHTYTAQRLVTLTRLLTIKFEKIRILPTSTEEDKETYFSLLKFALETINCILVNNKEGGLRKNLRLIYELLYQRRVVKRLEELSLFPDYVHNLKTIVEYFDLQISNIINIEGKQIMNQGGGVGQSHMSPSIESSNDVFDEYVDHAQKSNMWSSESYLECIHKASQFWSTSRAEQHLKVIPFFPSHFSEDGDTEPFFISYLWSAIARNCLSLAINLPFDDDDLITNTEIEIVTV